jgi:hypothetical protein
MKQARDDIEPFLAVSPAATQLTDSRRRLASQKEFLKSGFGFLEPSL